MISIEHTIRQNFESRLRRAQESFDSLRDSIVMKKLIELHDVCPTDIYSIFHKINPCGFEDSLENFENLLCIVENFYDDSFYGVIWEVPESIVKIRKFIGNLADENKQPYILQVFEYDDLPWMNEVQFCDIIQWYIDQAVKLNKKMERSDKGKNK